MGVGAAILGTAAVLGSVFSAHQQSQAQKRASDQQRQASERANQLQAQANNRAEQENNRASKNNVRNYDVEGTGDNGGIFNSNGALGYGSGAYSLGKNNQLGSSASDDDFSLF